MKLFTSILLPFAQRVTPASQLIFLLVSAECRPSDQGGMSDSATEVTKLVKFSLQGTMVTLGGQAECVLHSKCWSTGLSIFGSKWDRLALNGTSPGLFKIRLQYIFDSSSQSDPL